MLGNNLKKNTNKYVNNVLLDNVTKIKKPIYKGCVNKECFCSGDCKIIIRYE